MSTKLGMDGHQGGVLVPLVEQGEGSLKEEDKDCIVKEETDSFDKDEDSCNTLSSFSPAVSRRITSKSTSRITMGVRGIKALEEWCRRAVQVRSR